MRHGKDLKIYCDETCIAACKSCSVKWKQNLVDIMSEDEWAWEEKLPAKKSWEIQCSGLVTQELDTEQLTSDKLFKIEAKDDETGDYYMGYGRIRDIHVSATVGKITAYSCTIEGSGPLGVRSGYTPIFLDKYDYISFTNYTYFQQEIEAGCIIKANKAFRLKIGDDGEWKNSHQTSTTPPVHEIEADDDDQNYYIGVSGTKRIPYKIFIKLI